MVAVVGAGPYGLAVAAHLRARGVPTRVFGTPLATWTSHMPAGMFLKSEGFASNIGHPAGRLTLRDFCAETGRPYADVGLPVPLETFVAYGVWFQRQAVPEVEPVHVARIAHAAPGFRLELESGELVESRRIVLATGVVPFAFVPSELEPLGSSIVTHTSDHASFEAFRGREVVVIGAGQSALETAVLLRESGASPHVVARGAALRWNPNPEPAPRPWSRRARAPMTPLGASWKFWLYGMSTGSFRRLPDARREQIVGRALGPAGAWWLRNRLSHDVRVSLGSSVVGARELDGSAVLRLAAGHAERDLRVDHVIAGTGYRVDIDRLRFLAPELRALVARTGGSPRLTGHFESSVPGLYFVGLAAANAFGPAMRFVFGSRFAARRVAAHVA
jgi:cation diffusion facilitator CzcD-associated flavoprotein CzcO